MENNKGIVHLVFDATLKNIKFFVKSKPFPKLNLLQVFSRFQNPVQFWGL